MSHIAFGESFPKPCDIALKIQNGQLHIIVTGEGRIVLTPSSEVIAALADGIFAATHNIDLNPPVEDVAD